jgi:hypothetical protein
VKGIAGLASARNEFLSDLTGIAAQPLDTSGIDKAIYLWDVYQHAQGALFAGGLFVAGTQVAAKGATLALRSGLGHHTIPKWAGGSPIQWIDRWRWRGWGRHKHLDAFIKARIFKRFGKPVGGPKGGEQDWIRYFKEDPQLQRRVLDELLDSYRDWDRMFGTDLVGDFWLNIMDNRLMRRYGILE